MPSAPLAAVPAGWSPAPWPPYRGFLFWPNGQRWHSSSGRTGSGGTPAAGASLAPPAGPWLTPARRCSSWPKARCRAAAVPPAPRLADLGIVPAEQRHRLGDGAAPDRLRVAAGDHPGCGQDPFAAPPGEHHDQVAVASAQRDHVPAGPGGLHLHRPAVAHPGPGHRGQDVRVPPAAGRSRLSLPAALPARQTAQPRRRPSSPSHRPTQILGHAISCRQVPPRGTSRLPMPGESGFPAKSGCSPGWGGGHAVDDDAPEFIEWVVKLAGCKG